MKSDRALGSSMGQLVRPFHLSPLQRSVGKQVMLRLVQYCLVRKYFLLLILIVLHNNALFSQQIQVGTYNFYEGFSKGLIKAVTTDGFGFVWIATDEGLIRFDGKNSLFFKNALPGGFAKGFLKRPGKPLLVVHDYGVTEIISRPDTTAFRQLVRGSTVDSPDQLFFPKSLYEDRRQRLWIGENQAVARLVNGQLKKYRFPIEANSSNIYTIYRSFSFGEDRQGQLWVLSFSGELYFYDENKDTFIKCKLNFPLKNVGSFTKIRDNVFWIGAQNGLFEIELAFPTVKKWRQIADLRNISCGILLQDEYYAGTWQGGLFKMTLQNAPHFTKVAGLPFQDMLSLAYDANNGLWVAGSERVVSLTSGFFKAVPLQQPSAAIEVMGILPDSTIVIGTWEYFYLVKRNPDNLQVTYTTLPLRLGPTALLCEADRLWIGTLDGSVFFYDRQQRSLQRIESIQPGPTPITKIVKDQAGNIWMSGNKRYGLLRLSPDGHVHTYQKGGLAQARSLHYARSNILLVGGTGPKSYLYCYFPTIDSFINLSVPLDFTVKENFTVSDIITAKDGNYLLATSHGLLRYDFGSTDISKNKVQRLDLKKVPLDEPIRALQQEEDGTLWISTTSGLLAYDRQSALLYGESSGLPSNNLMNKGLLLDFNNNLWVGTSRGLAIFQRNLLQNSQTPSPLFTGLQVNGVSQGLQFSQPLRVATHSNLEINYLALSFPADKLQYQTRLIGKDTSAWTPPSAQSYRIITNLPPGDYTLQVRAQQHGGFLWSAPSSIAFIIKRAWYQQWWAIALFAMAFLGGFTGAVRAYNWRLLQQKKKLEALVAARTEEIKAQDQKIIAQNEQYRILKERQLQEQIDHKNKQLMIYTLHLIQKNESLKELQLELNKAMRQPERRDKAELRHYLSLIDYSFRKDDEWEKFKLYFESVHHGFFENLMEKHPSLTPQELRLCALIRLNLSIPEIATILGISADSVKNARFRIRKKMELAEQESLVDHVMKV